MSNSKKNILECIKIVRGNQNLIEKEDYNKLLTLLYTEIGNNISSSEDLEDFEKLIDDLKRTLIINKINYNELKFKSIDNLRNYQYKDELINEFKLLEYLLEDKSKINYDFQINPIILEYYDKNIEKELNQKIKFMLNFIANIDSTKDRTILFLLIMDLIFKNFNIIINNKKFSEIVLKKIKENAIMINKDIKDRIENINYIYENWIEIIENFNYS
jgi:hypothetical protein